MAIGLRPVDPSGSDLQQEIDKYPSGAFDELRRTCGFTDEELVSIAAMAGANFKHPIRGMQLWIVRPPSPKRGEGMVGNSAGICAWRYLMKYHREVLENEYNARNSRSNTVADST